jgi:hypothetical protein
MIMPTMSNDVVTSQGFGDALKRAMRRAGVTIRSLSETMGIPMTRIRQVRDHGLRGTPGEIDLMQWEYLTAVRLAFVGLTFRDYWDIQKGRIDIPL